MDAAAFATLYDRYERRVYNLCYRITGSPDDAADATQETFLNILERLPALEGREVNFGAYVMTTARNASYDALQRRKRSSPTSEIPDAPLADDHDLPERAALRQAHQEQIRAAHQGLPLRQREVLALRELGDLSYDEVAQIMGMNQNSVAQLISRARINLRDGLRQTALGSIASASPQCDRALPLLAAHQDGVLEDPWLAEHLIGCGACRVRLEAMEEAAVAYRQWLLLAPALWLRAETAEAAERLQPTAHRGRRALAAAGVTLVMLVALAMLAAEGAQTPTRAFAPAATQEADEPVRRVAAAPKPRTTKRPQRRRSAAVERAGKPAAPRAVEPPAYETVVAAAPRRPAHEAVAGTPERPVSETPAPHASPRRDPRPPEPVVPADPPPVVSEPVAPAEPPPAEPPPCVDPDCPGGTPPPPCTSAAGCPPPPRLTCATCGLVATPRRPPLVTRTP